MEAIKFEEYLEVCYEDIKPYLLKELHDLRNRLIALPENSGDEKVMMLFEEVVKKINEIDQNKSIESRIDTEEREGLCDVLYALGNVVGLDAQTEYIDNWRTW